MVQDSLLSRAITACDLIAAGYEGRLHEHGEIVADLHRCTVDAMLLRRRGVLWLVIMGSSGWRDWQRNLAAQLPWGWGRRAALMIMAPRTQMPARNSTGQAWAAGFLMGARAIHEWLRIQPPPDIAIGHSKGAGELQILACKRKFDEAHAIAAPRVLFGNQLVASYGLHSWCAADDFVCKVPFGAHHVGDVHWLPELRRYGEEHRIGWYRQRFVRVLEQSLHV